jgi:membrane protease YdiL (CAAX protease family)
MASATFQRQLVLAVSFPLVAAALLNGFWVEPLYQTNPWLFWAADTSQFLILPAIGLVSMGVLGSVWPGHYGFRSLDPEYSLLAKIGLFIFIAFLFWLFYYPVRDFSYRLFWQSAGTFGYDKVIPTWGISKGLVVLYLSVTAALVEEAVFRSLPWLYMSLRYPNKRFVGLYVLVTSVLFGAIHWEQGPHGVLAAFSLGIISAFMYSKLLNIWPFVVAHFFADLMAFG